MQRTIRWSAALVAAALAAASSPLALGWGNDPANEPSTPEDLAKYIWHFAPDDAQRVKDGGALVDRIYFNGQMDFQTLMSPSVDGAGIGMPGLNGRLSPTPAARAVAYLGYWRDCNNDGYIGDRVTGLRDYPAAGAMVSVNLCPPGSDWNPGTPIAGSQIPPEAGGGNLDQYAALGPMIHELVTIGPDTRKVEHKPTWSINDTEARVWADITRPDQEAVLTRAITPLPHGTFDSWNGHLRYADDLTFSQAGSVYKGAAGNSGGALPATIYDTPLASAPTPLYTFIRLYGQESTSQNNPEGKPLVKVWDCNAEGNPELSPGANAPSDPLWWNGGSVGDSINNTVKGLVIKGPPTGVKPSQTPWYDGEEAHIGQGCDGPNKGHPAQFPSGLSFVQNVGRLQYEVQQNAPLKDRTDFYFQYFPPGFNATAQLAPGKPVPTSQNGIWVQPVNLLRPTTNPQEFGYGVTKANWWVFYAKVNTAGKPASAFPAAQTGLGTVPSYKYGEEACTSGGATNGWDCSAWPGASAAWLKAAADPTANANKWRVVLGETYQFRDTDCTDLTPAAPGTWTPLRQEADDLYKNSVVPLLNPWPGPPAVFVSMCG